MKVKINANFICPVCGKFMFVTNIADTQVITCFSGGCSNRDKYFKLPEIEVEEYENRDSKKPD